VEERRGTLLLVGLILLHLVVISHQVDRGGESLLERLIFGALSPVQNAVSGGLRGVQSAWRGYIDLRGVRSENAGLRERNRQLEVSLQESQHLAAEAERLRRMVGLQEQLSMETIVAQVVGRDGVPWFRTFTINRGTADGVKLEAPVLASSGVVGRVISVVPHAAKVQLLLDRQAGVMVEIQSTGATGVTEGQVGLADTGSRDLLLKYVGGLADVKLGEPVVTSGLDQVYPKGLMVGRVSKVGTGDGLFKEIHVTPSVQFDQVEEVLVVKSMPAPPDFANAESVAPGRREETASR
jgi:rod shape-determining protein MreC